MKETNKTEESIKKDNNKNKKMLLGAGLLLITLLLGALYYFVLQPILLNNSLNKSLAKYEGVISEVYEDIYVISISSKNVDTRTERLAGNVEELKVIEEKLLSVQGSSRGDLKDTVTTFLDYHNEASTDFIYPESEFASSFNEVENEFSELLANYPPTANSMEANTKRPQAALKRFEKFERKLKAVEVIETVNKEKKDDILSKTNQLIKNLEARVENRRELGEISDKILAKYPYARDSYSSHPLFSEQVRA